MGKLIEMPPRTNPGDDELDGLIRYSRRLRERSEELTQQLHDIQAVQEALDAKIDVRRLPRNRKRRTR